MAVPKAKKAFVYINTGAESGQIPMLHGSVAGLLGEDVDSKKIFNDFQ